MNSKNTFSKNRIACVIFCIFLAGCLLAAGIGIGYQMHPETEADEVAGHVSNPAYEYMVSAAAWQMSAEAHALMMQGFHLAQSNVDDMVAMADGNQQGYRWVEENGQRKLFLEEASSCCEVLEYPLDAKKICTIQLAMIRYHTIELPSLCSAGL